MINFSRRSFREFFGISEQTVQMGKGNELCFLSLAANRMSSSQDELDDESVQGKMMPDDFSVFSSE